MKGVEANKVRQTGRGLLLQRKRLVPCLRKSLLSYCSLECSAFLAAFKPAGRDMTLTITAAGTTVVTTHLIHLGLRYLPFQFVKHRSLRHRSTRRQSMDGSLFPLRLRQAAVNITIGLETTVQTRAIRHRTWARDGESAATARDRLAVERVAKRSSSGPPNSESVIEPGSGCRSKQASYEWRSS
jgi:hypothetical protein